MLTQEEKRLLRECALEGMIYRSIPLAGAFSMGAYIAMYKGFLKSGTSFSVGAKMLVAGGVGWMYGRMLQNRVCKEKFMQLPNSAYGQYLRKAHGRTYVDPLLFDANVGQNWSNIEAELASQKPIFDDHRPDQRDHSEGMDEYQKVSESLSEYSIEDQSRTASPAVHSYNELQLKNRQEYASRLFQKYKNPADDASLGSVTNDNASSHKLSEAEREVASPRRSTGSNVRLKNQYGDVLEE